MDDTIKNSEIRPLDVQGRTPLYVYCTSYKGSRQLMRYGDVGYSSQKAHYTLLYVNEEQVEDTLKQLNNLKFVKEIKVGCLKNLTDNFSEAFIETNRELKEKMEC